MHKIMISSHLFRPKLHLCGNPRRVVEGTAQHYEGVQWSNVIALPGVGVSNVQKKILHNA